jgi:uncharacterized iron-regulated membrane protein
MHERKNRWIAPIYCLIVANVGFFVLPLVSARAGAQATTTPAGQPAPESTASTPMASVTTAAKSPNVVVTAAQEQNKSPHIVAQSGPPVDEVNRKTLQERAGKEAAKLLMRSTPTGAQIFINDAFVGRTPLMLIVAPGKYKIQMRGPRGELAASTVGLLPNETQEIALPLKALYPTAVPSSAANLK